MQPRTEELLHFLLWSTEKFLRPTFRNLDESYESWAYRKGLLRQLTKLEREGMLESKNAGPDDRLHRLSERGRLHVLGGRDPEVQWNQPWDGRWRLVLFDVPIARNTERARLRRYLRLKGFGCLQSSVWITPHPLQSEREILGDGKADTQSLLLLEAHPSGGESNADIVEGAWDFERINDGYERHMQILRDLPRGSLVSNAARNSLKRWAAMEREAWLDAVTPDPLLPNTLLPAGYVGQKSWRLRMDVLREAFEQLATFKS